MPESNLPEVDRLNRQVAIAKEALNDIVNASRDEGLAAMCNWMRGRASVAARELHALDSDEKTS